nr:hypothetical protein L321_18322 [Pseudomonas plecoglossicida NB2011]
MRRIYFKTAEDPPNICIALLKHLAKHMVDRYFIMATSHCHASRIFQHFDRITVEFCEKRF